jgi:AraC-like DNA-binding protein
MMGMAIIMMTTTVNGLLISVKTQQILAYIQIHYNTRTIRLSELAEVFHNHPAYLSRKFKKEVGTAFHCYISSLRIGRASQLLVSTEKSIKEIGYEVGFSRSEIFSKAFKRIMGCSPKAYRTSLISASLSQNPFAFPLTDPNASGIRAISQLSETPTLQLERLPSVVK